MNCVSNGWMKIGRQHMFAAECVRPGLKILLQTCIVVLKRACRFNILVVFMQVSEQSPFLGNEGIESVIGQVESYLAEGKLAEAAEVLEKEVAGTKAEELAAEWARQARTRAIMEQALQLIQSHAVAIASSLA